MMDLDEALFAISEAADACPIHPGTARSWVHKDYLKLGEASAKDRPARARGSAALLSARTTLTLALAAKLVRRGFHPQVACLIPRAFTVFGTDPQEASPEHNRAAVPERSPGELFGGGYLTALIAYDGLDHGRVLPMLGPRGNKSPPLESQRLHEVHHFRGRWFEDVVSLWVNPIYHRVMMRLGQHVEGAG